MIEYENLAKLNKPFFREYAGAFNDVLESGWFILGNRVKDFEKDFASYCGVKHCVGVGNGLDALIISLKVLNLPPSSEVIVPSNTYIATILSILHCGLTPVLVEPDIHTYNIDPLLIEQSITASTRAIIVVHLYGKMCDMDPINAIAQKHKLAVIEDCAQAHGARYKNKMAGTFSNVSAYSFYPTKNLGALADGGAIVTGDDHFASMSAMIRNYGSNKKYFNEFVGMNSRLDEVQAAFLSVKLKALDKINDHKRRLAAIYLKSLKNDFILPQQHPDYYDVYHIFNVRHQERDRLREYLLKEGIGTEIHYPVAPNKQVAMKGILDKTLTPIAEEIHNTTLSLPVSYFHTEEDVLRIVEVMNKF